MEIEYEAKFINVSKDGIRERLKKIGAKLIKPEFMQFRVAFNLPKSSYDEYAWVRVRNEGDKTSLSFKRIDGTQIENQKEVQVSVDNFDKTCDILRNIGCTEKARQESKRELWVIDEVEVTIDEWPFLEPYIEIEGKSEEKVKEISQRLGFSYQEALFGAVGLVYSKQYGIQEDIINNKISTLTFKGENPILKYLELSK